MIWKLETLMVRNIMTCLIFQLRSQTRQSEMAFRKIPGKIINENKAALKHAQTTDPKLDII